MDDYLYFIAPCLISRIAHILEQHADSFSHVKEACYLLCSLGDNLADEDSLFICTAQNCLAALKRFQNMDEYSHIASVTLARKVQSYLNPCAA